MKALVTGASGFVGRHLLGHLRANGDDAVGVDRECDVTDVKSVLAVLESVPARRDLSPRGPDGGRRVMVESGGVHPCERAGHEERSRRRS